MRTSCLAGWHRTPRCCLYSLSTFSHLRTRHLWQPRCVIESCRSNVPILFAGDRNEEKSLCSSKQSTRLTASHKATRRHHLLSLFFALVFALTIYPTQAHAQIIGDLEAKIPFQFHVGNTKLPAGEYRIHVVDDADPSVMEITSVDGSASAVFQVQNTDANPEPANTRIDLQQIRESLLSCEVV